MMIIKANLIGDHFCDDANVRDGHVHVSKSVIKIMLVIVFPEYSLKPNIHRKLGSCETFKNRRRSFLDLPYSKRQLFI